MRDSDVRAAVRRMLGGLHAGDDDTRVVEEMGVWSGSARIDIATINGELSGYELKSDSDTLLRLKLQVELYGRVFDRLTLVVGSRHSEKAISMLRPWWGVMIAYERDGEVELEPYRHDEVNPERDPYFVAQLLWRNEALGVLDTVGLAKGYRSKPVKLLHQRLAAELPFPELAERVRAMLKRRAGWLGEPVGNQG